MVLIFTRSGRGSSSLPYAEVVSENLGALGSSYVFTATCWEKWRCVLFGVPLYKMGGYNFLGDANSTSFRSFVFGINTLSVSLDYRRIGAASFSQRKRLALPSVYVSRLCLGSNLSRATA